MAMDRHHPLSYAEVDRVSNGRRATASGRQKMESKC